MNKVNFFGKEVTKLIVGDNPFNGYAYISEKISGKEMQDFYTAEKIKETANEESFEKAFVRIVKGVSQ